MTEAGLPIETILKGAAAGLFATAVINLWALLLNRTLGIPVPNRALMGRWFAWIPRGQLFHDSIAKAPPVANETLIGWLCHLTVGATFGVILALLAGPAWRTDPTLWPALLFGIATVGCGWFLMQPGMGLGLAASRTPSPWRVRANGLAGHVVFGLALWVGAMAVA